jgi:hypothetical protein
MGRVADAMKLGDLFVEGHAGDKLASAGRCLGMREASLRDGRGCRHGNGEEGHCEQEWELPITISQQSNRDIFHWFLDSPH